MKKKERSNVSGDFVKLGSTLGGILLVIVVCVLIFIPSSAARAIGNIVWGFVVLGLILAFFQYMTHRVRKK